MICTPADVSGDFQVTMGSAQYSGSGLFDPLLVADPQRVYLIFSGIASDGLTVWPASVAGDGSFDGINLGGGSAYVAFDFRSCGPLVCLAWYFAGAAAGAEIWWIAVRYQPTANNPPPPQG